MDIGCGNAAYFNRLNEYAQVSLDYLGIDIYKDKSLIDYQSDPRFSFQSIESFSTDFVCNMIDEGINLISSIFTLEHIENDLRYLYSINEAIQRTSREVLQIHVLPSAECLYYYFLHGFRQYTPRTLSKFTRLYSSSSTCYLIGIGGNQTHKYFLKKNLSWRIGFCMTPKIEIFMNFLLFSKMIRDGLESF